MKSDQYYLDKYKPILYLHHKETILPIFLNKNNKSRILNKHQINNIPYYAILQIPDNNEFYIDLVYIFIYPSKKKRNIRIRINKFTEKIIYVYFKSKEYSKNKLRFCDHCDTLKVYIALHTHKIYSKPINKFLFSNKTSSTGMYWYPDKVINVKTLEKDFVLEKKKNVFDNIFAFITRKKISM